MTDGITGIMGAGNSANAARTAGGQLATGLNNAINTQNSTQSFINNLLNPYNTAGTNALSSQQDLLGLNGNNAQTGAIGNIINGSEYQGLQQQGNNAILQNASATGGLRGGNTEGALAQFSPQLLQSLIQQQFSNLGSLSGMGLNSATTNATTAQNTGNNISNFNVGIGQANAGATIGAANAYNQMLSGIGKSVGSLAGIAGMF